VKLDPATRLSLLSRLEMLSGGKLEMFFASHGLGGAYAAPGKNWGKAKHIASAMTEADKRGQGDEILSAAAAHFGLSVDERIGSDQSDAEIDDLPVPLSEVQAQRQADSLEMPKDGESLANPRSSPEGELCLLAFEAWDATGEWPIARVLQRRIERDRGRLDVEVTGMALNPHVGYLEQKQDGRVVLKVGGMIGIPNAERYLSAFLAVIQLAYRRYVDADSDEPPVLSDEVVREELSLDSDMTWRIYSLLDGESFLLEGGGSRPEKKTFRRDISPHVRYFREVRSADDYVRARDELLRPFNNSATSSVPAASRHEFVGGPSAASDRGNQVFNTVIFGGNAAVGPNALVQVSVRPGDLSSLMAYLAQQGVDEADRDALVEAIESDEQSGDEQRPGTRVRDWLGRVSFKVAATGTRVGEQAAAALIAAAIAKYLGLL
jgi:hypothetical protein